MYMQNHILKQLQKRCCPAKTAATEFETSTVRLCYQTVTSAEVPVFQFTIPKQLEGVST